jgi:hypothetical protein
MTLILTVANASGVYQSSDYQLTNQLTGAPISDQAGSKQLQASFKELNLNIAFTGIAGIGNQRTVDWISAELRALPQESHLQHICQILANRATAVIRPLGSKGVLALIIATSTVGKPFRIAVISNIDWSRLPIQARPDFSIAIRTIRKPLHIILPHRNYVSALQRRRLRALARDNSKSSKEMMDILAEINAVAASHSHGYVSEDCWVTSQVADGRIRRFSARNVGGEGYISQLMGGIDLSEWIKKNFKAAPGKVLGIVQAVGATFGKGDATPVPPPSGEARRFKLSGSGVVASLRSPAGDECATIEIAQLDCLIEARCNEQFEGPFAKIVLRGVRPIGRDFPKPLLPWPGVHPPLMLDGVEISRGWEYSVGYWIAEGAHYVDIPQSSRSIRNVAFLGPEDELVIVAPSKTLKFVWAENEEGPTATMHAKVWWRSRLDGTRG